jgi:hypothetical protein
MRIQDEIEKLLFERSMFWADAEKLKAAQLLNRAVEVLTSGNRIGPNFVENLRSELDRLPKNPSLQN